MLLGAAPLDYRSICDSEVITLSIFARWSRFASERDFYRYAEAHLRGAFPTLPGEASSQFNRLVPFYADDVEKIAVKLGQTIEASEPMPYPRHSIVRPCPFGMRSAADMGMARRAGRHRLV